MPGCPVTVRHRAPCNWGAVVVTIAAQFGHQDGAGNIVDVEKVNKPANVQCNQEDGIDSARPNANIGALAIVLVIAMGGKQHMDVRRINTPVPGQPLSGAVVTIEARFEYDQNRDDTDVEKLFESLRYGVDIKIAPK